MTPEALARINAFIQQTRERYVTQRCWLYPSSAGCTDAISWNVTREFAAGACTPVAGEVALRLQGQTLEARFTPFDGVEALDTLIEQLTAFRALLSTKSEPESENP